MANTIKIKRGLKGSLPTLNVGELAYCTDTEELFIGTSLGNKLLNSGGGAWGTITGNLADQSDLADMVKATDQTGTTGLPDLNNITMQGNTFNGANQLVKLDANGKLPAIDGSALLNVSGGGGYSNIDGGTPYSVMGGITPIDGGVLPPLQP